MIETPLVGLISGVVLSLVAVVVGSAVVSKRLSDFPASARLGVTGLLGAGIIGTIVFLLGLISTHWLPLAGVAVVLLACLLKGRHHLPFSMPRLPKGIAARLILLALLILVLLRVPAALTPSTTSDWDSISHQLAMAKLWIEHGRVDFIPFMHQSNIPATANMLFMLVMPYGGQYAGKVLGIVLAVFALLAIGGITEKRYGKGSGWWAALAILAIPVITWEIGTAYIDVIHGAAFALAALFAAIWLENRDERRFLALSAAFLGMALATKYTAIQTGVALGAALVMVGIGQRAAGDALKGALTIGLVGLALASPWYVRNVVNTGNPVYPFFYSVFGGTNWSEDNARAYAAEQQSFGIGQTESGKDPLAIPGSVAALALRPDLQINQGTPIGAVGPVFLIALLWWPFSGFKKDSTFEKVLILTALITLVTWFFLTQQSRYIISLALMAAPLIGGAIARLPLRVLPTAVISLQAAYTGILFGSMPLDISNPEEALGSGFEFYPETQRINQIGRAERIKVALYDEVRGYYLNVPYFWANPGHHTMLPYESYKTPEDLIRGLKSLGTTHICLNLEFLGEQGTELALAYFDPNYNDFRYSEKFRVLIIEACRAGLLDTVEIFRYPNGAVRSFLFKIR